MVGNSDGVFHLSRVCVTKNQIRPRAAFFRSRPGGRLASPVVARIARHMTARKLQAHQGGPGANSV
jgi:hypothetical protein